MPIPMSRDDANKILKQSPELLEATKAALNEQLRVMEDEYESVWRLYNVKINSLKKAIKDLEKFEEGFVS